MSQGRAADDPVARPGATALVVFVPQADDLLKRWRAPNAGEAIPAHITILVPFLAEADITEETRNSLAAISAGQPRFPIMFSRTGRFPGVLYLDPEPSACPSLIAAIRQGWPQCVPYGRPDWDVIPHLTVLAGADEEMLRAAEAELAARLPLVGQAAAMTLLAFDGRAWIARDHFPFG